MRKHKEQLVPKSITDTHFIPLALALTVSDANKIYETDLEITLYCSKYIF